MRTIVKFVAAVMVVGLFGGCVSLPKAAAADYHLPAPQAEVDRAYLGLSAGATNFQFEDIGCEILVVDCFDMYCHLCQNGAKHVKELYDLAQTNGFGNRVKFVGLGVGDTPLEVAIYKDKFKIPFPVFPDRHAVLAKRFGELRVPNVIIVRNRGGHLEVIHCSPGALLNPADLLQYLDPKVTQYAPVREVGLLQTGRSICDQITGCGLPPVMPEGGVSVAPVAH